MAESVTSPRDNSVSEELRNAPQNPVEGIAVDDLLPEGVPIRDEDGTTSIRVGNTVLS